MSRITAARLVKFTAPITYIGAAISLLVTLGFGFQFPLALTSGLFTIGIINLLLVWAFSHPFVNYDGKCNMHFHEHGLLTFFCPLIIGLINTTLQDTIFGLPVIGVVFLVIFITMMIGWAIGMAVGRKCEPQWQAMHRQRAQAALQKALEQANVAPAKRADIEARAADASADDIFAMVKTITDSESQMPGALR